MSDSGIANNHRMIRNVKVYKCTRSNKHIIANPNATHNRCV